MRSPIRPLWQQGFTLVEAIIVIVITGILATIVAQIIAAPVKSYFDSVRRAELTDQADVAMRRMVRDIRLALPNSLRVTTTGGSSYIEFIMTSAGGRYRASGDGSTSGTPLSFSSTTNVTFDVLGTMPTNPAMAVGDYVVVYNLGPGYSPANAYVAADPCTACNRAQVASIAGNAVTLASNPFGGQAPPLPSPDARFQVVPAGVQAVSYVCPTGTAGNLSRYANYGFTATQATPPTGTPTLLAGTNVTCTVDYATNVLGRNGLLYLQLTLTSSGESVTLFSQIHIDNSP
jgi:MSHA biogenesis protein MshO